ncbi:hypothetical protein WJX81_008704 [Elliptochloris bilobata]|uniref:Uncharacterized protein n=1 Tax=Elliptochloris bilobata TaxID=381761 RepID=A0AAW1RSI1_9CHLO
MPLTQASAWVKKAVGTEAVFVRDHHDNLASAKAAVLARLAAGEIESFAMLTRPALAPPWGARYQIADMRFLFVRSTPPLAPGGFTVMVEMTCSASELRWLWALQGVLEGVLLKQASSTARAFCDFVRCRCAEHAARRDSLGQRLQQLPAVRTHVAAGAQRPLSRTKFGDSACSSPDTVYYDVVEYMRSDDDSALAGIALHAPIWRAVKQRKQ